MDLPPTPPRENGEVSAPSSKRAKMSSSSSDTRDPDPVDATASSLTEMSNAIKTLSSNQTRLLSDNATLIQHVTTLTNQVTALQRGLDVANRTLTSIHYGTRRLNGVFRFPNDEMMNNNNSSSDEPAANATVAAPLPPILPTMGFDPDSSHHANNSSNNETPSNILPIPSENNKQPPSKSQAEMGGEKFSDNNLFLVDLLIQLKQYGCIDKTNFSKSNYPRDIVRHSGNSSYVKYCLELVEFVAKTDETLNKCIETLADDTIEPTSVITKKASEMLVDACAVKIEEFDSKKVRKKTAIGFGSRIRDYKKMILRVKAQMYPKNQQWTIDMIELMEREEFDKLRNENYEKYYENREESEL
eukprot:scaffold36844_cov42-Cyclotella_meneghiniana.AAC.5